MWHRWAMISKLDGCAAVPKETQEHKEKFVLATYLVAT